jgi:hypothetical protein
MYSVSSLDFLTLVSEFQTLQFLERSGKYPSSDKISSVDRPKKKPVTLLGTGKCYKCGEKKGL